jgi:transcription factor C subunit 3
LLLARADKFPPPSHLSDLSIAGLMETSGRERRHRYYTVANYYKLISEEALDKTSSCFTDIDLVNIGRFYAIRPDSFYENDKELVHRQDAAKDAEPAQGSELKIEKPSLSNFQPKRGRPGKPICIQGNPSAKRKRKTSPLSGDGGETSGSEESLTKRRRLNGTGINAAGMLAFSIIH